MADKPLDVDSAAIEEGREAYAWYAERSAQAAASFMEERDEAMHAIAARPTQHATYHFGYRSYLVKRFP